MEKVKKKTAHKIKRLIVAVLGIILLIGCIIGLKSLKSEKKSDTIPHFMEQLNSIVDEINDANKVFESDAIDLNEPLDYMSENDDMVCYRYRGDDREDYLKKVESIYVNPSHLFASLTDDDEINEVYVCKPKYCGVAEFSAEEVYIIQDDEEAIKGQVRGQVFELQYDYDAKKWKVVDSILVC